MNILDQLLAVLDQCLGDKRTLVATIAICLFGALVHAPKGVLHLRQQQRHRQLQLAEELAHDKQLHQIKLKEEKIDLEVKRLISEQERFERETRVKQQAAERAKAQLRAEQEIAHLKDSRSKCLLDLQNATQQRTDFQGKLNALLTNEDGQRVSNDPALIAQFVDLLEKSESEMAVLDALKLRIPPEYKPNPNKLVHPSSIEQRNMRELENRLEEIRHVSEDEIVLSQIKNTSKHYDKHESLETAISKWRKLPEDKRTHNEQKHVLAMQSKLSTDAAYYGFLQFTTPNPPGKKSKRFFHLTIQKRSGIRFRGNFQLGPKTWPAKGEMDGDQIVFKSYKHEKSDTPFVTFNGVLHRTVLSGTFTLPQTTNPGHGHFYSQKLHSVDAPFDPSLLEEALLEETLSRFAPGAVWKGWRHGYYQRFPRPRWINKKQITFKILSRNGKKFTAIGLPDKIALFNGTIDDKTRTLNLRWHSNAGDGNLVEYTASIASNSNSYLWGSTSLSIRGVVEQSKFLLQYEGLDRTFWNDPLLNPKSETARSNATASYQTVKAHR